MLAAVCQEPCRGDKAPACLLTTGLLNKKERIFTMCFLESVNCPLSSPSGQVNLCYLIPSETGMVCFNVE